MGTITSKTMTKNYHTNVNRPNWTPLSPYVFKDFHSGDRIRKCPDTPTEFAGYVWTQAVFEKKIEDKNFRIRLKGTSIAKKLFNKLEFES